MKLKEGDYVNIQGLTDQQRDALVAKFIKDGCPKGEFSYNNLSWKYVGWADGKQIAGNPVEGIWYFFAMVDNYFNGKRELTYEQAIMEGDQVSEFKSMKFWIGGDKDLFHKVGGVLEGFGYEVPWKFDSADFIETYPTGEVYTWSSVASGYFHSIDAPEINIDWMRTPKKEAEKVELNGKTYLKSDLAEALKHIKPLDN
jgi:hypothetical protein